MIICAASPRGSTTNIGWKKGCVCGAQVVTFNAVTEIEHFSRKVSPLLALTNSEFIVEFQRHGAVRCSTSSPQGGGNQ